MPKTCPNCDLEIEDPEARYCYECGSELVEKIATEGGSEENRIVFCTFCGEVNTEKGARYCLFCGSPLGSEGGPTSAVDGPGNSQTSGNVEPGAGTQAATEPGSGMRTATGPGAGMERMAPGNKDTVIAVGNVEPVAPMANNVRLMSIHGAIFDEKNRKTSGDLVLTPSSLLLLKTGRTIKIPLSTVKWVEKGDKNNIFYLTQNDGTRWKVKAFQAWKWADRIRGMIF